MDIIFRVSSMVPGHEVRRKRRRCPQAVREALDVCNKFVGDSCPANPRYDVILWTIFIPPFLVLDRARGISVVLRSFSPWLTGFSSFFFLPFDEPE